MADSQHTTKPPAAPHRGLPQTASDDPVVILARDIQRLWDAYVGAGAEKPKETDEVIFGERRKQLIEWRSALELVGTFTVASSLPGAVIQIAWAMDELRSLAETLDGCQAGESEPALNDYVDRIRRLVKSAGDEMVANLGGDYEPIRPIVETYANLGDRDSNWLVHKVDSWAEQGILECAAAADKTKRQHTA